MNVLNISIVISGMIVLFIVAEVMSFHFKIYSDKFYVVFHFAGGALTYLLFLNIFNSKLVALGLVLVVGVLWEIHEWMLWKFFLKKKVYKPGGKDTVNDLIMDMLGALLFYIIK